MKQQKKKIIPFIESFFKNSKTKLTYMKLVHYLLNKTSIQAKTKLKTAKISKALPSNALSSKAPRSKKQKKP